MSRSYITENDSTIGKKRTDSISDITKQNDVRYNQRTWWWLQSRIKGELPPVSNYVLRRMHREGFV